MISRFLTEVTARFNPFLPHARAARLFLTHLPPRARQEGIAVTTQLLPRTSTEPTVLNIKFKDGKEMKMDCENMGIKHMVEEVDRYSRKLQKAADLADG